MLSLGHPRNNPLLPNPPRKLSITQLPQQPQNFFDYKSFGKKFVYLLTSHQLSSQTILVQLITMQIQFFIPEWGILPLIIILSMTLLLIKSFKYLMCTLVINLLICSPNLSLPHGIPSFWTRLVFATPPPSCGGVLASLTTPKMLQNQVNHSATNLSLYFEINDFLLSFDRL